MAVPVGKEEGVMVAVLEEAKVATEEELATACTVAAQEEAAVGAEGARVVVAPGVAVEVRRS